MSNSKSKKPSFGWKQFSLELIVVFIGVYAAFLLSNRQIEQREERKAEKVVSMMKYGIDRYQELFTGFVVYHEKYNAQFKSQLENGTIPYYGDMVYPQPQYPIDVITEVLTKESYQMFTMDIYLPLIQFTNGVERMMSVERRLEEIASLYRPLPNPASSNYNDEKINQIQLAKRFYIFLEMRKKIAFSLAKYAEEISAQLEHIEDYTLNKED